MSEKSLFEAGLEVVRASLYQAGWTIQPTRAMTNGYHLRMEKDIHVRYHTVKIYLGIILVPVSGFYVMRDCSLNVLGADGTSYVLGASEFFSYHGKYTSGSEGILTEPNSQYWIMHDAADLGAFFESYDNLARKLGRHQLFRPRGRTN